MPNSCERMIYEKYFVEMRNQILMIYPQTFYYPAHLFHIDGSKLKREK